MVKKVFDFLNIPEASAHCDIPCGIYDPHLAQIGAHTVIRMTDLIKGTRSAHDIARYVHIKEEHAELIKQEVRIIWGDYFKPEHVKKFPELHKLVWSIMKQGSAGKQESSKKHAKELLESVLTFAEIFWATKGVKTKRVKAPYPSGGEIVQPIL